MSIFNRKYNIQDEIDKLHLELRTIDGTKEFVKTDMWIRLRGMLLAKIMTYDTNIVHLSCDVDKHGKEIEGKYALRSACKGLVEGIETTLNSEEAIREKLKQLEEIAQEADL